MTSTPRATEPDRSVKYYRTSQRAGVWTAIVVMIGVIGGGSSLAEHSLALTASLLSGCAIVWFVGYWALSKNTYFISSTKAGFKDLFRSREIQFAEVRSANIRTNVNLEGMTSMDLVFQCVGEFGRLDISMPLDPMDQSWLNEVKAELAKRGITVTTTTPGSLTPN